MSRRDRAAGHSGRDRLPAIPSTGWRLRLVPAGSDDVDPEATVQLALRCLPRIPVAAEEVEHWLEHELEELRRHLPQGTIRLSRLMQALPTADVGIGWLIELELPEAQPLPRWYSVASVLRDLRLLGLQPTLLTSPGTVGWPSQQHTARVYGSTGAHLPAGVNGDGDRPAGQADLPAGGG
jgi:hypothetical protein